jgi:hypothetical protein
VLANVRVLFDLVMTRPSRVGDNATESMLGVDRLGAATNRQGATVNHPSAIVDRQDLITDR